MTPSAPVKAVDLALATIARYDRSDLDARLQQARARLLDEQVRVLVVGEFKQGKSLLVNGLVRAPVCPVHDDMATSVPTVVRHADTPVAALVRVHDPEGADNPSERRIERVEVPIDQLAEHVAESGNPGNRERWNYAEIGLPRGILAGGLELVDTPGVGGLNSVHGAATMAALPSADAVLLVSDASQEYTRPELEFLRQATKVCPNVACVLTKIDLYPEWRRIAELDRAHLTAANIDAELLSVSSTLRLHSIRTGDTDLDAESGFPVLISYLRESVVGQADLLARRSTVHDVLMVTDQLAQGLRAEQKVQQDPAAAQGVITQLTEAQQRSAALKERSARWQHTLNDGVTDLNADIDYDLRDRMREIVRQAEEEVDRGGDPRKTWDQLSAWVEQEVASAMSANLVWATQRARWLATRVADHFSEEEDRIVPKLRTEVADALGSVRAMQLRKGEP
ncbi:MAG: dynamin family protein, partial [Actinobacteria bacterium]|nr:dynamin family protein [Actinomycetota bacterium]